MGISKMVVRLSCLLLVCAVLAGVAGQAWCDLQDYSWIKYDENPVITTSPRGAPCVMQEGDSYSMWLSANASGIYYSNSTDGVSWSEPVQVLSKNTYANWEPWVIKDGSTYKMWYRAHSGAGSPGDSWIDYATSPDGVNWTRESTVLTAGSAGSFDSYAVSRPRVVLDDGVYRMWYEASSNGVGSIGYATSADGVNWTKHTDAVLTPEQGTYYSTAISPAGVYMEDDIYYLITSAWDGTNGRLGLAWSTDGINFTCSEDPIIDLGQAGQWDAYSTGSLGPRGGATIAKMDDGDYWLWYTGQPSAGVSYNIGLAYTPEPTSAALLLAGCVAALRRRRK